MGVNEQISWKQAWQTKKFRQLFLFGTLGLLVFVSVWPVFLGHIEKRSGMVLNDALLAILPPTDLSVPIFAFLWICALLLFVRLSQQPRLLLLALICYWLLFVVRMLTIFMIPLDPPPGLLKLNDPISNMFYGKGGGFITKDLFFSGHTATLFLIFLFLEKKWEKRFALLSSVAVGVMVLFQHIHYTIDVVVAPLFAYGIYWMVNKWMGNISYVAKCTGVLKKKRLAN